MKQIKSNKICFRVDSSNFIGIGHIKRSINIALSLQDKGFEPIFLTKNFQQITTLKLLRRVLETLALILKLKRILI